MKKNRYILFFLLILCGVTTQSKAQGKVVIQTMVTKQPVGIQLYTVRDIIAKKGLEPTLKQLYKIGYQKIESASYDKGLFYSMPPEEFKALVERLNLEYKASHVGRGYVKEEKEDILKWWTETLEAHKKAGVKYVIIPWQEFDKIKTETEIKEFCLYLNEVGKMAKESGMKLAYHNHKQEFEKIGDKYIMDLMLENTNPEYLSAQFDVYWLTEAGVEVMPYLERFKDRIISLHIKDDKIIGKSGKIDFKAIFKFAKLNKITELTVEQEAFEKSAFKDLKQGLEFIEINL